VRTTFESYKAILSQAVAYPPFVNANVILADATTRQDVLDRIAAQGPDVVLRYGFSDVMASGGIVGTKFSVDDLDRRIAVASGSLGAEERAIFNASTPAPFEAYAWFFKTDSTATAADVEVHVRPSSLSPWRRLSTVDAFVLTGEVQFSLSLPSALGSALYVTELYVLGRQI
jgi:hypothetical protein